MAGSDKQPKFGIQRRMPSLKSQDDFATVFAGDFADRPAMPQDIPTELIDPSPYQARQEFPDLEELADSIRTHGFTSRIRVRPHPTEVERYQLVYGERRLRAAKLAGLSIIPCDVAQHSDADLREIGLAENIIRRDLTPLEEAQALRQALDARDDDRPIYSIRTLATRLGKDKGYIQNRLKLLEAPADVQEMVSARPDTMRVAREISKIPTVEARAPLIEGVLHGSVNAQQVAKIVRDIGDEQEGTETEEAETIPIVERVSRAVQIAHQGQPADRELTQDLDQLQTIMTRLSRHVPNLAPDQRQHVLSRLDAHMALLEEMLQSLQ